MISKDFKGFEELHERLREYPDHKIGFELPHGPIVDYLRARDEEEIYSLNPLKMQRFKETVNVSGNKSDPVDARAIAVYLKKNGLVPRRMTFNSKEVEELNVLRVSHDRLTKENARFSNRLRFIVRQYFPLYDTLFTEIACKTGLELLLKYPTWESLKHDSKENLMQFLKENRYRNTKNIERFFAKTESYSQVIAEPVVLGLRVEAQAVARILLTLKEELGTIESRMEEITESHELEEVFKSLPGAGTVLSGELMAVFGDDSARPVKREASLEPHRTTTPSGTMKKFWRAEPATRKRVRFSSGSLFPHCGSAAGPESITTRRDRKTKPMRLPSELCRTNG